MADEIEQGDMSDAEFEEAVEELTAEEPEKSKSDLAVELAKLQARRSELKHTKPADLKDGEYAEVKMRIAEIEKELGK